MAYLPSVDQYDLGILVASLLILAFAYFIYPIHIVKISAWLTVFTIYVCWMAFFLWRWMFDVDL